MSIKITFLAAVLASSFVIAGCERRPTDPPQPKAMSSTASTDAPVPPPPVRDPSLPAASAVMSAPTTVASAPAKTFNTEPMSRPAESAAMPLGGQANDHSAPKAYEPGATGASASGPR